MCCARLRHLARSACSGRRARTVSLRRVPDDRRLGDVCDRRARDTAVARPPDRCHSHINAHADGCVWGAAAVPFDSGVVRDSRTALGGCGLVRDCAHRAVAGRRQQQSADRVSEALAFPGDDAGRLRSDQPRAPKRSPPTAAWQWDCRDGCQWRRHPVARGQRRLVLRRGRATRTSWAQPSRDRAHRRDGGDRMSRQRT